MLLLLEDEVQRLGHALGRDWTARCYPRQPVHARGERRHYSLVEGALLGQLVRELPFVLDFSGTFGTDFGLEILYVPDSFGAERHVMLEDKFMYLEQ